MKEALTRLLTSAKVWTTIIGLVATAATSLLARFGLDLSDAAIQQAAATVAGLFGLLLVGQAAAGAGKERVAEQAKAGSIAGAPLVTPLASDAELRALIDADRDRVRALVHDADIAAAKDAATTQRVAK